MTSIIRNGFNWIISFTRWGVVVPQISPKELPQVVLKKIAGFIDDPITLRNFAQACRLFSDIVYEIEHPVVEVIISTRMEDYFGKSTDSDIDNYEFESINIQEKKPSSRHSVPESRYVAPESRYVAPGPVPGKKKKNCWWQWLEWTSPRQLNSNWPLSQLTYLK